jgi:hypothetical protein
MVSECDHWLVAPLPSISQFFTFLKVEVVGPLKEPCDEPLIEYTKSIMMTSTHYLATLEQKASKEATTKEYECMKQEQFTNKEKKV